ncbi:MFS transporter, partial [Staphylococcus epidermidis]|uniref:MFS transporter n=2 Tax=Staphylococcus TaxID=1279 RepID=UPI002092DD5A
MNSSKYFDHLVVLTAGIGMFLSTLDSGIINVALPILSKSFNVDASFISWSITLYTLLLTGTIIIFGRLSDKYNRLNI